MVGETLLAAIWKDVLPRIPPGTVAGLGRLLFSRSWRRFDEATRDPSAHQRARLSAILDRNRDTAFGKEHGFTAVRSPEDYRKAVPVRTWTDFEPYVSRMTGGEQNVLVAEDVFFYARSSGTTGTPKHVPVTESYVEEYRAGRRPWMRQVISAFPGIVCGSMLTIHSPRVEGRTLSGVPYGSITIPVGLARRNIEVSRGLQQIPMEIFLIPAFEAKYYYILRFALETRISLIGAINPSTVVLFCKKLDEFAQRLVRDMRTGTIDESFDVDPVLRARLMKRLSPNPEAAARIERSAGQNGFVKPAEVWPELCGLLSWKGGSAPFYLSQFPKWFGDLPVMDYGYAATEGNFTVPMDPSGSDGVLIPNAHYLEFIPENERERGGDAALPMERLEPGGRYFTVVTASNGLYRYDINDVVECTGFHNRAPKVAFLHKGGAVLSITGEKVTEAHVVEAAAKAAARAGAPLRGFTCTVRLGDPPHYVLAVEPDGAADEDLFRALLLGFDGELARQNIEYESKRNSLRLAPPRLLVLAPGSFELYRQEQVRLGAPDSHCKPPHLAKDEAIFSRLTVLREIETGEGSP